MSNRREPGRGARDDEEVLDHELLDDEVLHDDVLDDDLLDDEHLLGDPENPHREHTYDVDHDGYDVEELGHATDDDDLHPGVSRRGRRTGTRGPVRAARRLLVLLVAVGLVAVAAVAAVSVLRPMVSGFGASNDYPGPGSGSVEVVVNPGDTGRTIGATLEAAGVVKSAKAFSDAAAGNPAASGIQPGTYTLPKEMKAADAVAFLTDTTHRSVPRVTIREGLWKTEVFAELAKQTGLPLADYEAAAKDAAALGLPAGAQGNIEGYLFPATYELPPKSTAVEQLQLMVQKSVAELTRLGIPADKVERTMILASIVEAEGRRAEDRPKIARVIENRLAVPMRLQLDSTVSYGVQKRSVTTTDAERATVNDYNTYARDGLPVGPIGNPGAFAIEAATNPTPGTWLYFVAVNPSTGETRFATTDAEHQQNVREFQAWCSANKGQC
jgi:UPF0755 protein